MNDFKRIFRDFCSCPKLVPSCDLSVFSFFMAFLLMFVMREGNTMCVWYVITIMVGVLLSGSG